MAPKLTSALMGLLAASGSAYATAAPSAERQLYHVKAASAQKDLLKRSDSIFPSYSGALEYINLENIHDGARRFVSKLHYVSPFPVIELENLEHLTEDIECRESESRIDLKFRRDMHGADVRDAFKDGPGYIITSHEGCNEEGERALYKVEALPESNVESFVPIEAVRIPWKGAMRKLHVTFGYSNDGHSLRRHTKRQEEAAPPAEEAAPPAEPSADPNAPPIEIYVNQLEKTYEIPAAPEDVETSIDLNFAVQNQAFDLTLLQVAQIPIRIGCEDCSTTGFIDVSQGGFDIDINPFDGDGLDVVPDGNIELTTRGVGARMEFFASPVVSDGFSIELFSIPVLGVAVPGVGELGLTATPTLDFNFALAGTLEVTAGFEVKVPDGANVNIAVPNFEESTASGFDIEANAIPFSVNASDIGLKMTAAFRPELFLGFSFLADTVEAGVSLSMGLPALSVTLTPQANVDSDCQPLPGAEQSTGIDQLGEALGTAVLVETSIGIDITAGAGIDAEVGGRSTAPDSAAGAGGDAGAGGNAGAGDDAAAQDQQGGGLDLSTSVVLFQQNFPIASQCIPFNAPDAADVAAEEEAGAAPEEAPAEEAPAPAAEDPIQVRSARFRL